MYLVVAKWFAARAVGRSRHPTVSNRFLDYAPFGGAQGKLYGLRSE